MQFDGERMSILCTLFAGEKFLCIRDFNYVIGMLAMLAVISNDH